MKNEERPREYLSDDWDIEQNRLVIFAGGNGDWYVSVVEGNDRVGPAVRITTSGARPGYEGVALHIARAYRALPEQVLPPPTPCSLFKDAIQFWQQTCGVCGQTSPMLRNGQTWTHVCKEE